MMLTQIYLLAVNGKTKHDGFHLLWHRDDAPKAQEVMETIVLSLSFIAQHDPRRYQIIVRNIKVIYLDTSASSLGAYYRLFRICVINYEKFFAECATRNVTDTNAHSTAYFASLLVHEATHGKIDEFFVPYDAKNREAIEKLCIKEEERFMSMLYEKGLYSKVKFKEFNPKYWNWPDD